MRCESDATTNEIFSVTSPLSGLPHSAIEHEHWSEYNLKNLQESTTSLVSKRCGHATRAAGYVLMSR